MIPQTGRYAIRALVWLAQQGPDAAVTTRELADATGVPTEYLAKILRRLVVAELLRSRRGRGGGYTLALGPERIRYFDILDALDQLPKNTQCAFGWGKCDAAAPCPMHESWSDMTDRMRDWATGYRLSDALEKAA